MLSHEGRGASETSCQSVPGAKGGVVVTLRKCDHELMSLEASWGMC